MRAAFRLLTVELALRCHDQEKGRPPTELNQLVPSYLKAVPLDPFTGRQLVYHLKNNTNWLLYSAGLDGVDNGGALLGRGNPPGSDIFYNSWY